MVGFQLNSEESKKILELLGIGDVQLQVYLGLIAIGSGTLGEISIISGIDILQTRQALNELEKQNYINSVHTETSITRYIALEPFLKGFYITYDSMTLATMRDRLKEKLDKEISLIEETSVFENYIIKEMEKLKDESLKEANDLIKDELNLFYNKAIGKITKLSVMSLGDAHRRTGKILRSSAEETSRTIDLLIENIKEVRQKLKIIFDTSHEVKLPDSFNTDVLIGESSVGLIMRDLITRAKTSLFILMPQPEIQSIMLIIKALKQNPRLRITVIGNLVDCSKAILNKLLETSARVKQFDDTDFWAVVKDSEELVFAPEKKSSEEEMIGLISHNEGLVNLISGQMQSFSIKAKDIKL